MDSRGKLRAKPPSAEELAEGGATAAQQGMRKRKQRGELKRQAADGAAGAGPSVR